MDIQFNFWRIKLDQFAAFDCTISKVPTQFQTAGDIEVGSYYEEQIVSITVSSKVKLEDQLVLTIKVICYFKISTESWESLKTDGVVVIPRDFLFHLGGLAVSTVRGILFAKTDGTDLNRYIMPVFNMDNLIDADLKIVPTDE